MMIKLLLALVLVVGPTTALFGKKKTTSHQGASKEEENMQTGGGSTNTGTFKFNVEKKPLFKIGTQPKPIKFGGGLPIPQQPAKPVMFGGDREKEDMEKARQLSTMSIAQVLQKFPNKDFSFRPQSKSFRKGDNLNAVPFLKISKGTEAGVVAKAPVPVEFPVPGVCKPVDYCEDLATLSKIKNGFIWPASITYPKCGGCCLPHQESVAVTKKQRKVHIVVISFVDSSSTLAEHTYDEHESCECVCKVKKEQCNKVTQEYDPNNCRCNCKPDAKEKVKCGPNQQWSDIHCGCVCKFPDTQCGSYRTFDNQTCKCVYKTHGSS